MENNFIKDNLCEVHKNIEAACKRAGRNVNEVTLLCVSKTKPASMVETAMEAGEESFGENHVQEIVDKFAFFEGREPKWHMIGHLQRNKVKYIVDKVELIHSVESVRLAEQISSEAAKKGITAHILIEVNMADEESKFGIKPEEAKSFIREISSLPSIKIDGLMTVAPYTENAENNRIYFRQMKELSVDIANENIDNVTMSVLSMGMTGDYEVAIEEGATHVRVGTGIFGNRIYT